MNGQQIWIGIEGRVVKKIKFWEVDRNSSIKSKYAGKCWWGTKAIIILVSSLTKEAGDIMGTSKV